MKSIYIKLPHCQHFKGQLLQIFAVGIHIMSVVLT